MIPRKAVEDVEKRPLIAVEDIENRSLSTNSQSKPVNDVPTPKAGVISSMGLKVLALLALQNSFKNILMRFVMTDHGGFLLSTAIIVVELLKLAFSVGYIVLVQKQSPFTVVTFIKSDWKNTFLLVVPATSYSLQMSLEYIAMANIDPASFSVLVQMKMLTTALFFRIILKRRLMKKQLMSLAVLTVGVMLCSIKTSDDAGGAIGNKNVGIAATLGKLYAFILVCLKSLSNIFSSGGSHHIFKLHDPCKGIACSSGFASVFTEKVIKTARKSSNINTEEFGLAHMQAQLAIVSLVILGLYAFVQDFEMIMTKGFFYNYDAAAAFSSLNSAVGGLIVAAVLKHADSVLKGYATAVSVVLTGTASKMLFGTELSLFYGMGMINVIIAVLLYNSSGLDDFLC